MSLKIVCDKLGVCVFIFIFKDPVVEFFLSVSTEKREFLATFILCHTKVWDMFSVVLGTFKRKELTVLNIILNSNVKERYCLLYRLDLAIVVFWSDILLA